MSATVTPVSTPVVPSPVATGAPETGAGGDPRPHVVIVGGGFGGMSAARALADAPVRITLVDRTNHHVFQPLLYQVATAVLNPSDISVPIRWVLRHQKNVTVLMGQVDRIDPATRTLGMDGGTTTLSFDYLILATGARHAYFGHPEWERDAPGLKSLEDAIEMRRRFLLAFEAAERSTDDAERDALLTFVIVGGGPTGVELAGIIPDVAKQSMREDFRRVDPARTKVVLIEGGPRILPTFPEALSARAREDLARLGVTVRTGAVVTAVDDEGVSIGDERIPARTVFWGAGNQASPLARQLGETDRAGRAKVQPDQSLAAWPNVFVVGDAAASTSRDGSPVPAVAPAANQTGEVAARSIVADLAGRPRPTFQYVNKGDLAVIGRHRAIAAIRNVKLTGTIAWIVWLFVHILYLVGFRNRLSVLVQWAFAYFTHQRGVRLITHGEGMSARSLESLVPHRHLADARTAPAAATPASPVAAAS
jgi:NADH dehydrogenase